MDEKELMELLAKLQGAMDAALAKAKAETDPAKAKTHLDEVAAKSVEFTAAKANLDIVRAASKSRQMLAQIRTEAASDTQGANLNPGNPPSDQTNGQGFNSVDTAQSAAKDQRDKKAIFFKYLNPSMTLSGNERRAISAKEHNRKFSALGEAGVLLPQDIAASIINANYRGKSILSTDATGYSTDSGVSNLRPATLFVPELIREPVVVPQLFDRTKRVPAGDGKVTFPTMNAAAGPFGGVAFTWPATEGLTKTETKPHFGSWEMSTHELSGYTSISLMALTRSHIQLEPFIVDLFGNAVRYELSKRIMIGNGTTQPKGILTDIANSGVKRVARQQANAVSYQDLINLKYGISQGFRVGSEFWLNDGVEQNLQGALDKNDRPLFANDVSSPTRDRLIGFPYSVQNYVLADSVEAAAAGGAVNDTILDLGDEGDVIYFNPQMYGCGVEMDIAIARSEHVQFLEGKVVIRLMMFVGGAPILASGIAVLVDPA